jgi:regulatory protein
VPEPADATELALRALRHRSRTRHDLEERLDRAGVTPDERSVVLDRLTEAGLLSDDRFAEERARALAERGASDALIRHDLRRQGVEHSAVEHAIAQLEPEDERAARVFRRRGGGAKALRYLASRGFASETLDRLAESDTSDALE